MKVLSKGPQLRRIHTHISLLTSKESHVKITPLELAPLSDARSVVCITVHQLNGTAWSIFPACHPLLPSLLKRNRTNILWLWVKIRLPGDHWCRSMFLFTRVPHFGYPFLTHSHVNKETRAPSSPPNRLVPLHNPSTHSSPPPLPPPCPPPPTERPGRPSLPGRSWALRMPPRRRRQPAPALGLVRSVVGRVCVCARACFGVPLSPWFEGKTKKNNCQSPQLVPRDKNPPHGFGSKQLVQMACPGK